MRVSETFLVLRCEPILPQWGVESVLISLILHFKWNHRFLWQLFIFTIQKIGDCILGKGPWYHFVPVRKSNDLCRFAFKIKLNLAPLAVAVCLIQVGRGGFFVPPLLRIGVHIGWCQWGVQWFCLGCWVQFWKARLSWNTPPFYNAKPSNLHRFLRWRCGGFVLSRMAFSLVPRLEWFFRFLT